MADIDLQSLDWRQALRVFEQICILQPDDVKARTNLVGINFRLGREEQAVIELDNYISYLRDNNQDQVAVKFLEELAEEYPKSVSTRRRLAAMYQQLGRNEETIAELDAVGEILINSGDRLGAIRVIEMILELDPPNKVDYQRLVEQLRAN